MTDSWTVRRAELVVLGLLVSRILMLWLELARYFHVAALVVECGQLVLLVPFDPSLVFCCGDHQSFGIVGTLLLNNFQE